MSSWTKENLKRWVFRAKSLIFSCSKAERREWYGRHRPVDAHQPLHSARSCRSRAKVAGAACGEPGGKVCETADGRATFKNDVKKMMEVFWFPCVKK